MKIKFYDSVPAARLFPPVPAKKLIPEWYKELSNTIEEQQLCGNTNLSVKKCVPVLDFMTSGYIIRNYADIYVKRSWSKESGEDINLDFKFSINPAPVAAHSAAQFPLTIKGHQKNILKFTGVWGIETPLGYSCLFYQPEYFNETRFRILPAIVDTDKFIDPVSFPFKFNDNTENEEYIIEAGTPLAVAFPFKRESWEHEFVEYDNTNKAALYMKAIWQGAYKRFMHTKKEFK